MYFLGLDVQDLWQNKIHTWSFELQMMLQPHLGKKSSISLLYTRNLLIKDLALMQMSWYVCDT